MHHGLLSADRIAFLANNPGATAAVPEPGTLSGGLLLLAGLAAARRHRTDRRRDRGRLASW